MIAIDIISWLYWPPSCWHHEVITKETQRSPKATQEAQRHKTTTIATNTTVVNQLEKKMCFKLLKSLVYNNRITYITTWKLYGGPQVQSENLSNPVQKNKYQHKKIYFSTKVFISVPKNIFQSKNIYFSTKKYISIQKYLFQYKKKVFQKV